MEEAVNTVAHSSPSEEPIPSDHAELMDHFRLMLAVTTSDDLASKVLLAISCIEGKTCIVGSVSFVRKAETLVGRWLANAVDSMPSSGDALRTDDVIIERDTIVLLNVKFGKDASTATVQINFRAMGVYEKYYSKWFMSKQPFKKWKLELKSYKLKVRMLDKNVLNKFNDVESVGNVTYRDDDICQIVEGSKILDVVRKLQQTFP